MNASSVLKQRLVQEIERLPDGRVQEVLDFVGYLLSKEQDGPVMAATGELDPAKDPILRFIGGAAHGSLAQDIDKDLYGA